MNELVLKQVTGEHMCTLRREAGLERQLRRVGVIPDRAAGLLERLRAIVRPAGSCATC